MIDQNRQIKSEFEKLRKELIKTNLPSIEGQFSFKERLLKSKRFRTSEEARLDHLYQLTESVKKELDEKRFFRMVAFYFMLGIVALHFISSVALIGVMIYAKLNKQIDILSDQAIIAIVVSMMLNFLGTIGIIFKYLFSNTSETYNHIEMMSQNINHNKENSETDYIE